MNSSSNQLFDAMAESREHSDKAATNSKSLNVILLGETGVGKTSFINGGANFLKFGSMDDSLDNGGIFLVDTSFTSTTQNLETFKVFIQANTAEGKTNSQNEGQIDGQSKTQNPIVHNISWKEEAKIKSINLIDTPGMMDTLGRDVDEQNQRKIRQKLLEIGSINAVLILLKPNESRLKLGFRVSLTKILNMLAEVPAENLLFCFTNTQSLSYRPGDSIVPLTTLLKDFSSDQRRLTANKSNMFCFDSNPIRQMAEILSGKAPKGSNIKATEHDWQMNIASWKELLKKIEELVPFEIKSSTIESLIKDEPAAPAEAVDQPPEIQAPNDSEGKMDKESPPTETTGLTIDEPAAPVEAVDQPPEIQAPNDSEGKMDKESPPTETTGLTIDEPAAPVEAVDQPPEIQAPNDSEEKMDKESPPTETTGLTIDEPAAPVEAVDQSPGIQSTNDPEEKMDKESPPTETTGLATESPIKDKSITPIINFSEEILAHKRNEDPPPTEIQPPSENPIIDPKTKNAIKERLEAMAEKITQIKREEVDTENSLEKVKSNHSLFNDQATDILEEESTYKVIKGNESYMMCMNETCSKSVKITTGGTVLKPLKKCYVPCETKISFQKRAGLISLRCFVYFLRRELLTYCIFFPSWIHLFSLKLLLTIILPPRVGIFVNKLKNFSYEQYLMELEMGNKCTQCKCGIQNHQPTKNQFEAVEEKILEPEAQREYKKVTKEIKKTSAQQQECEKYQKALEQTYSSLANNAAELSVSFFFNFSNETSDPFLVSLAAIQSNERMKKKVDERLLNKLKMIENEHKERVEEFLHQMKDGLRKSVEFEEINIAMALIKPTCNLLQ